MGQKYQKISYLPTPLAALAWLCGAVFLVKQGFLQGRFYVLILIFFAVAMCASLLS